MGQHPHELLIEGRVWTIEMRGLNYNEAVGEAREQSSG